MILALSLVAAAPANSCVAAMARRAAALRPVSAEITAMHLTPRHPTAQQLARASNRYPPLREMPRITALHAKLVAIVADHPYRNCDAERLDAQR